MVLDQLAQIVSKLCTGSSAPVIGTDDKIAHAVGHSLGQRHYTMARRLDAGK